jgi:glycosyltransferase involved in cell wall biosynthesis
VRILYFADIRFPLERANGIQTIETCHALASREHTVHLIVRPDTHTPPRDPLVYYGLNPIATLTIERAPVRGPAFGRRLGYLAFILGRASGRARADVILTRDLGAAAALLRMPPAIRPPVVYESHGYAPDVAAALPELVATANPPRPGKLERLRRREARVWRDADGYVTITSGLAEEMTTRFGRRVLLAVVPDGTRTAEPRVAQLCEQSRTPVSSHEGESQRQPATRAPVVAYAGHLYPWKGVDVLLEALALLPDVHGLIIGGHETEPDLARLKDLAVRLNIGDRVEFTGLVQPRRVPELLDRADILVLPNPASAISTRFTSPLKMFEYMAAGRPIVASDLPSIREVLTDGETALLVRPGNAAAIAATVRRLIEDRALAARLARSAQAAVADFSWQRRAERLELFLADVVQSRR